MSHIDIAVQERVTRDESQEIWPVYDEVFHDTASEDEWLQFWEKHCSRTGFKVALARSDGDLVAFAYGYTGQPGQWWTDQAMGVLDPQVALEWLGGHFELVSIGVIPGVQGHGIGRRLLETLTTGLTQERWMLMTTADATDPARRLYASDGWIELGPGLSAEKVIMGKLNSRAA
ncbi:GNAT family N-acetyltransferase [Rudaeicoccus suwonensis]|uniref:Acetyltransferase (GNAT) family protein n=1 Tax=Rudaeicoccus suwonensis TaxID=657409 RepID=A0A561E6R6_9MICO|nr:GNAT family N-acetyltransferase [Rudaeicoccus suwonensis]TWE11307.1 acetyltransferase (GNAT) family protein [Rudaeicoccus suwonensis]